MGKTVKLSHLEEPLRTLTYPVARTSAAEQLDGITVRLADGEADLGELVAAVSSDSFDSAEELRDEVYGYLPEEALGEPGQSEGDA